jgi:6-bladed beta-propeller protein
MRSAILPGVLLSLLSATGRYPAQAQTPRVVENTHPAWQPAEALRLASKPTLVIGTQGGAMYEFARVVGAARLHDGRIVVADGGSLSLRFFDSTGTFLKSVGRHGEGPGEFKTLRSFFVMPGDTMIAGDAIGALSYFTGTGEYIQRRGVANPPLSVASAGLAIALAPLDGSGIRAVAALPRPRPRGAGSRWVDSFPVAIVDAGNSDIARIGVHPVGEVATSDGAASQVWFTANAVFAGAGGPFYIGYGSEYVIRVYTVQGQLRQIIRRSWTPVRVTNADIDRYVIEWGKRWIKSTGAEAEAERTSLRKSPFASTIPAFSQFIADRVGRLWVREAHLADAPGSGALNTTPLAASRWSVFDPNGHWLGDVTMPARFQPRDIGADYVLGSALDEDDVPRVVLYRLGTSATLR